MRVMIVDDSASMRLIVERTLEQAGHDDMELSEARDGVDALARVNDCNPHLIPCDWNMPNMNGIDFLKRLREAENSVRFGFVTTESTTGMRNAARQAGAQFLIAKPFTPESFGAVLAPMIGR